VIGGGGNDAPIGGKGTDQYLHSGTSADGNDVIIAGDNGKDTIQFGGQKRRTSAAPSVSRPALGRWLQMARMRCCPRQRMSPSAGRADIPPRLR
jgi:hypothetical protein